MRRAGLIGTIHLLLACAAHAAGPTGYGSLMLGMTIEQIAAIPSGVPGRPVMAMNLTEDQGGKRDPGVKVYETQIADVDPKRSIKAMLRFRGEALASINLDFGEEYDRFQLAKAQIEQRYGSPETKDVSGEEQCIYRNGAAFKLPERKASYTWRAAHPQLGAVQTVLWEFQIAVCPSNLRYGSTMSTRVLMATIELPAVEAQQRSGPNPF